MINKEFVYGWHNKRKSIKFCSMLRIHLEARHPSLHLVRIYVIELRQDLFGDWIIETTYGRLGSRGQTKLYAFKTVDYAIAMQRLEGLEPDPQAVEDARRQARGEITMAEARANFLTRIKKGDV
jgi:predicted DNA-binding WGR domain protein